MEKAEGLLGGKFLFKRQNDRTIDKTKVVCSICQAEFSYHRSSSSLSYLNARHPTESSTRLDGRQPTLHDFSRKITRPVREKVTNALNKNGTFLKRKNDSTGNVILPKTTKIQRKYKPDYIRFGFVNGGDVVVEARQH